MKNAHRLGSRACCHPKVAPTTVSLVLREKKSAALTLREPHAAGDGRIRCARLVPFGLRSLPVDDVCALVGLLGARGTRPSKFLGAGSGFCPKTVFAL